MKTIWTCFEKTHVLRQYMHCPSQLGRRRQIRSTSRFWAKKILLHLCNTSVDILKIKLIVQICYYWEIFAGYSFNDPRWCGPEDSGAHLLKSLRKMNSVQKVLAGYQSANHEDRIIEKTNIEENVVFATHYDFLWMFFSCPGQLNRWPWHSLTEWVSDTPFDFRAPQSCGRQCDPRH